MIAFWEYSQNRKEALHLKSSDWEQWQEMRSGRVEWPVGRRRKLVLVKWGMIGAL